MTTLTGLTSTSVRQSSALSSAASGPSDSTSGQSISNFSSLLAAFFAPPPIVTPNQAPVSIDSLLNGSQQKIVSGSSGASSGTNTSQSNVVDSLSSLLFANSLANQSGTGTTSIASTLPTNQPAGSLPGDVLSASVLGRLLASNTNSGASLSAPLLAALSPPSVSNFSSIATPASNGQSDAAASTISPARNTADFLLQALASQTTDTFNPSTAPPTRLVQNDIVTNGKIVPENTAVRTVTANAVLTIDTQTSTTTGLLSSSNQASLSTSRAAAKSAAQQTLADSLKSAIDLDNANRDALNAVAQQLPTPIVLPTNANLDKVTNPAAANSISINAAARQNLVANTNQNLNLPQNSANSNFVRQPSSSSVTGTTTATSSLNGGTVSVVVTPGVTTASATAENAAVASATDSLAVLQSTNVLNSPILNNGRTPGQSVILPSLPQSPLVPPAGADAFPNGFYSVTGIDRPADAVTDLDGLKSIDTTAGGSALFARERSDIADLNSLLRGQEPKLQTDNSSVASNGNNFAKTVEIASNLANPALADQPSRVLTQIADAVAERAQVIREKGSTEIRMRLDPPDLGTIDIRVHSHKGELRADITAADPAVRTMIESQLADLRSSLEKSGLDFQSFNLNSGNRSDRGDQQPENPGSSAGFDRKTPAVSPVVVTPSAVVTPNRGALLDVTA